MAAYAALVSLMNDLEDIQNHPRHSFSFDNKQITSLSQTVDFLIDFLEIHNSHEWSSNSLESRIASAAIAAHDVIKSHIVDQIHTGSTLLGKARSYFLLDLQKANDSMDFFRRKVMQFKARSGFLKAEEAVYPSLASTSRKNTMVGFDAVRDQLMHRLTGDPSCHRQVIPLVGMGGIGKTTLAKNVYNLYIKDHFDVRLWATISQQYSVDTIFKQLSITGSGEKLHKKLWGRRYLIVLDDLWSIEAWDEIQMFMPDNSNGSCVIVTTRLLNLATYLNEFPFKMNFLDEDKSWELFCGEVFGQEKCPLELEKIGKNVVKRCRGLPLSITVIGGHLRKSSRAIEYWEKVGSLMSPISSLVDDDQCLQILSLSYHHLPCHLKPCFLYMGNYEEDAWINTSKLFIFWIAEGFLRPKGSLSLEEVADEYLKDLIERNLVLVRKIGWNGKVEKCGIHDSVRELCLKVSKKENFMCVPADIGWLHRLEMRRPDRRQGEFVGFLNAAQSAHSCVADFNHVPRLDFRFLRLSDLYNCPRFHLINLRYLNFQFFRQASIASLFLFWNVKTLFFWNYFSCDVIVPHEIWEMPQLRHLQFNRISLPEPLPNQEECIVLQNLHTIIGVVDFRLTEEVCKRIPNIKNLNVVYGAHLLGDFEAICPQNLGLLDKLEQLECWFDNVVDSNGHDFVPNFTFPSSLKKLSLSCYHLHWDGLTMMMRMLPHLEDLELRWIRGPEWHLVEEFPRLKNLKMASCYDLICLNADSSCFPMLEILDIWQAPELSEVPFDIGEIPTLRLIKLSRCSVSVAISAMQIVVEQESLENQDIQLDIEFQKLEQELSFQNMVREQGLRSNCVRLLPCLY